MILLPSERTSPLPVMRRVLLHAAHKPKKNLKRLKDAYDRSMARLHRERFFIGNLWLHKIKSSSGTILYTVVWIDPYTMDLLVLNHKTLVAEYRSIYGLLL